MRKRLILVASVIMSGVSLLANNAFPQEYVYFNDFEGTIGPEWSDTVPDITPSGGQFLSQSAKDTITLTLTNLPVHLSASVYFDLYLIESTEENEQYVWDLNTEGGPVLLDTTFNYNPENTQAYPDNYPGQTDDSEIDTPGNLPYGDMVYSFPSSDRSFTINHTDSTLVLHFSESGSATQSWGIDNVLVTLEQPETLIVVDIDPNTLNLDSNGNWITCYLFLPEEYNVADIDPKTVMLEDTIVADWVWFDEETQIAKAKFNRSAVNDLLIERALSGDVELSVTGALTDGRTFGGLGIIAVKGDDNNKNNAEDESNEDTSLSKVTPSTLNLNSNGQWITCHLRLPEGSKATGINLETLMLEGLIPADWMVFNEEEQIAMIKFSRSLVQDFLIEQGLLGDVELTVSGELLDGAAFKETDTIRIIDKGGKKSEETEENEKNPKAKGKSDKNPKETDKDEDHPGAKGKDGQKPKEVDEDDENPEETDEDDENPEETDEDDENPGKGKGGKKD